MKKNRLSCKQEILAGIFMLILGFTSVDGQRAYDAIHLQEREIGFGARALSLGGAYTAVADDYSAIYWNPAGLGFIESDQFYGEMSHLQLPNQAQYSGQQTWSQQTYTRFRSLGAVFPVPTTRGSLVLALGYNRIQDFDEHVSFQGFSTVSNGLAFNIATGDETATYLFDQNVLRKENIDTQGGLHQWSFGGSVALSPAFLIGATLAYVRGVESYHFQFEQNDSDQIFNQFPADFHQYSLQHHLESTYSALQVKIGGITHVHRWLRLGTTVTLPMRYRVQEIYSSQDALEFDDGFIDEASDEGQWEYRVRTPFILDAGAALTTRPLTLTASVRYRDWSQTEFIVKGRDIVDSDLLDYLDENQAIRTQYHPTIEYHAGGEIKIPFLPIWLRAGMALYPRPQRDSSLPLRELLTAGFTYRVDDSVSLDFSVMNGNWQRESRDTYTPAGTLETMEHTFVQGGFSYRF